MKKERITQILKYYEASKAVLQDSYAKNPEKFDENATKLALDIFQDTIKILNYFEVNQELLNNID